MERTKTRQITARGCRVGHSRGGPAKRGRNKNIQITLYLYPYVPVYASAVPPPGVLLIQFIFLRDTEATVRITICPHAPLKLAARTPLRPRESG